MGKYGTNPLPVALPGECRKAAKSFSAFVDPINGLDKVIPAQVLRKAKGFAFLTVAKAGFVFSARAGTGVVIARLPDGNWSAPSAIGTAGAGFGLQVGAEVTDFLILLNSRAAVQSFMAAGSLTLGGNLSVAAGPLGRNVEGSGSVSSKGGLAAMYSYSRTKGLFGGASVEGSVIVERQDANAKAYGYSVTAKQLLSGAVDVPEFADQLIETISRRSGNAQTWREEDEDDDYKVSGGRDGDYGDGDGDFDFGDSNANGGRREREKRPDMSKGYSFGTPYAAGGANAPPGGMERIPSDYGSNSGGGFGEDKEKKSVGGKFSSVMGRARSGSLAALGAGGRSRSGSGTTTPSAVGGPAYTSYKFDESFDDPTSSTPTDRERIFDFTPSSSKSSPALGGRERATSSASASSFGKNNSSSTASKLSKQKGYSSPSRANIGAGTGGRSTWDSPDSTDGGRESFESLDDEDPRSSYNKGGFNGRSGGGYGSDDGWGNSNSDKKRKPLQRFPSSTTPKLSSHSSTTTSPFADEFRTSSPSTFNTNNSSSRPSLGPPTKSYQTKPWDSDDDDLMNFQSGSGSKISSPALGRGDSRDAYDFGRVGDALSGAGGGGSRGQLGAGNRSRSGTIGKGLGSAVALFDFNSTEPGDLAFKKGEIITILKQDDEEWWTGRIALREGILPRNYVEFEKGIWL